MGEVTPKLRAVDGGKLVRVCILCNVEVEDAQKDLPVKKEGARPGYESFQREFTGDANWRKHLRSKEHKQAVESAG